MTTSQDLDNLEFRIVEEVWNEYELKDGTKIRGRTYISRIAENKNAQRPPEIKPGAGFADLSISLEKQFQVFAPKDKKSNPTPIPNLNDLKEDQKEEVKILTYSEPWNVYEIVKNGTVIRVKLVVSEIHLVKQVYDNFGEPFYLVKNSPVFDFKVPAGKQKFA